MGKVKFVIQGKSKQEVIDGTKVPQDVYTYDVGSLNIEDKCITGVLEGIKPSVGRSEVIQAWKKQDDGSAWHLCSEMTGSCKLSFGELNADNEKAGKEKEEE